VEVGDWGRGSWKWQLKLWLGVAKQRLETWRLEVEAEVGEVEVRN
jgi:hypothetical protein